MISNEQIIRQIRNKVITIDFIKSFDDNYKFFLTLSFQRQVSDARAMAYIVKVIRNMNKYIFGKKCRINNKAITGVCIKESANIYSGTQKAHSIDNTHFHLLINPLINKWGEVTLEQLADHFAHAAHTLDNGSNYSSPIGNIDCKLIDNVDGIINYVAWESYNNPSFKFDEQVFAIHPQGLAA